jgi:hypothetical protein
VRIELVFKGILPENHSFQGGERLILFQNGLFSRVEEMHISLQRKPSTLEAAASSHCFPLRVELVFERNTFCNVGFSRC